MGRKECLVTAIAVAVGSCVLANSQTSNAATVTVTALSRSAQVDLGVTGHANIDHSSTTGSPSPLSTSDSATFSTVKVNNKVSTGSASAAQTYTTSSTSAGVFSFSTLGTAILDSLNLYNPPAVGAKPTPATSDSESTFSLTFTVSTTSTLNLGATIKDVLGTGQNVTVALTGGGANLFTPFTVESLPNPAPITENLTLNPGTTYILTANDDVTGVLVNSDFTYDVDMKITPSGVGPMIAAPLPSAAWSSLTLLAGLGAVYAASRRRTSFSK